MRHFTSNGTDQRQNGSSHLLTLEQSSAAGCTRGLDAPGMYVFMYVCRHITTVCIHAGSSHVAEYRSTRVANPLRGQLHLHTSGTNNHIARAHRPTSAQAYVQTREITKIHQYTGKPKHPCTLRASLRLSMPNTVRVQVQRASPSTRAIA